MDVVRRSVTQGSTTANNGGSGVWGARLVDLNRGMGVEAGRAGPESATNGSGHRDMISGRGTNTELSTKEISLAWATHGRIGGCPNIEAVGHGSGRSWRIEAGAPLTGLSGGLLLLLDLLSQHLSLNLLRLYSLCVVRKLIEHQRKDDDTYLKSHHLELHHLHLHLRVGQVEGHAEGVHPTGSSLLGSKTVGRTIDGSGSRKVPVIIDVPLGHLANVIAVNLV